MFNCDGGAFACWEGMLPAEKDHGGAAVYSCKVRKKKGK